jgi:hypothetical protein
MASVLKNGHTGLLRETQLSELLIEWLCLVVLNLPGALPNDQKPSFTGGGFTDTYVFQQLHFHWGSDDSIGSEHTVNGKSYPGELHLVHYNSKYGDYKSALKHSDGLAVLGVLFQVSPINYSQNETISWLACHWSLRSFTTAHCIRSSNIW